VFTLQEETEVIGFELPPLPVLLTGMILQKTCKEANYVALVYTLRLLMFPIPQKLPLLPFLGNTLLFFFLNFMGTSDPAKSLFFISFVVCVTTLNSILVFVHKHSWEQYKLRLQTLRISSEKVAILVFSVC
jgi:hypothetical protein